MVTEEEVEVELVLAVSVKGQYVVTTTAEPCLYMVVTVLAVWMVTVSCGISV
jgi:hypothetical protein